MPVTRYARSRATVGRTVPDHAGFTLVELLISVTLIVIVGTAIVQTMLNQSRVNSRITEQVDVQHALRRGMERVSRDLRGLSPAQGDIMAFTDTSLTVRATIGFAVICDVTATGNTPTRIDLVPVDAETAPMSFFSDAPIQGDAVALLRLRDNRWQTLTISAPPAITTAACASSPFLTSADAAKPRYTLQLSVPSDWNTDAPVTAGDVIRILRPVRYSVVRERADRWSLSRGEDRRADRSTPLTDNQWTTALVAGPLRSATDPFAGITVRLFSDNGVGVPTPLTDTPANRLAATRIDLRIRGIGKAGSASTGAFAGAVRDSLLLAVSLRNQ